MFWWIVLVILAYFFGSVFILFLVDVKKRINRSNRINVKVRKYISIPLFLLYIIPFVNIFLVGFLTALGLFYLIFTGAVFCLAELDVLPKDLNENVQISINNFLFKKVDETNDN